MLPRVRLRRQRCTMQVSISQRYGCSPHLLVGMALAGFLYSLLGFGLIQICVAQDGTILDRILSTPVGFDILAGLLSSNDTALVPVLEKLSGPDDATLFAPTDDAFAKLSASSLAYLQSNPETAATILSYHIVDGEFLFGRIANQFLDTLEGTPIIVQNLDLSFPCLFGYCRLEDIKVNDAGIQARNMMATNGIIHSIDQVLVPPTAILLDLYELTNQRDLPTTVVASFFGDLKDILREVGPYTFFAPTEAAWRNVPSELSQMLFLPENLDTLQNILLYHVIEGAAVASDAIVSGDTYTAMNQQPITFEVTPLDIFLIDSTGVAGRIVDKDITATNGVLHTINKVLVPLDGDMPIVSGLLDTLRQDPDLTFFVQALENQPSILQILTRDNPMTIFAPTNSAFEAVREIPGYTTVETILLYHVGSQRLTKQNLIDFTLLNIPTFAGIGLDATFDSAGDVFVKGVKIIEADILASNGIIHKIEQVLIPPDPSTTACRFPGIVCDIVEGITGDFIDLFEPFLEGFL